MESVKQEQIEILQQHNERIQSQQSQQQPLEED
jgi:hypothetical protein